MTLAELLSPERVLADMKSEEHWPAIEELVGHLVSIGSLPEEEEDPVLKALKTREEQRSTGIGGGIAIPHCFSNSIGDVVAIFGRSHNGIDFCSLDRAPVHFVVLFVVPESQYTLHLKTLAAIAKILNSAETRKRIAEAASEEEIIEILSRKAAAA